MIKEIKPVSRNGKNGGGGIALAIIFVVVLCILFASCDGSSSRSNSSYQLHNKDGTNNWKYYNDMQDYFAKHLEKRP